MKKIGICFPGKDFLSMNFDEFKKYILLFKDKGLYSFDMYTSFLNNYQDTIKLLYFLEEHGIKVTFHYDGNVNGYDYLDDCNLNNVYNVYEKDLIKLRNKLQACNIFYKTKIVFHALNYEREHQKYEHECNQIKLFKRICDIGKELNFDILVETLSVNHPKGNHIGDEFFEIEGMIKNVDKDNFGICWDIGHTRLNHIDENSSIYPSIKIMEKVKFTHIHNFFKDNISNKIIDHLPLTNYKYQDKELNYLIENKYDGVFSLEMDTNNLKENINIYLDSIDVLKDMLKVRELDE